MIQRIAETTTAAGWKLQKVGDLDGGISEEGKGGMGFVYVLCMADSVLGVRVFRGLNFRERPVITLLGILFIKNIIY